MPTVKRLVLDVLKPHQPNALEFAQAIAALGDDYSVRIQVAEVDEKTESTIITITGGSVDYVAINARIGELGGSIHSIDEVEVDGGAVS